MINMISQLVPQQGAGIHIPQTTNRKQAVAVFAESNTPENVNAGVQGGMDTMSVEQLTQAVDQLNSFLEETQRGLRFSIDENSGRTVVRVIDTETDEVIRQIPSENMLRVIQNINEITGNIIDDVT